MATYYVDPTGTDDGSHGNSAGSGAWKTLTYALGHNGVSIAGGHVIYVATGTYTEGTGTGLSVARAYAAPVLVVGSTANPSACVIRSGLTNNPTAMTVGAATNVSFAGFRFEPNGDSSVGNKTVVINAASNITISDCEIATVGNSKEGLRVSATFLGGLTIERCVFDTDAGTDGTGISVVGSAVGKPAGITIKDSTFLATGAGISASDCDALTIDGCDVTASGQYSIQYQYDGGTPYQTGACHIRKTRCRGTGSMTHCVLLGIGSVGSIVEECVIDGYSASAGYGIVTKGIGDEVRDTFILAGKVNGLYFKGSLNAKVTRCSVFQTGTTGSCISTTAQSGTQARGTIIRDCAAYAPAGSTVFNWQEHDGADYVRLLSIWGAVGAYVPAHGYGSPRTVSVGPMLPAQHHWTVA